MLVIASSVPDYNEVALMIETFRMLQRMMMMTMMTMSMTMMMFVDVSVVTDMIGQLLPCS